ncbi:alpha/beta hydrolase family protein [soil metagenome]
METNRLTSRRIVLALIAFLAAAPLLLAQPASESKAASTSAEVVTLKLASTLMGREMPYRVILPLDYKAKPETRYGVVYLLHGLTGHYNNWTDRTRLAEYASAHRYIIVTPEGDNGWYTDSVSVANDKYESYIVKELIPEIDRKYRTIADRDNRLIAGLSMGGYGAIKFGLKYPAMFSIVGSFSGALGAASFNETNSGAIGKSMAAILGPADSETRRSNDIFATIRGFTQEQIKQLPFIYQSCGTEDFLIQNNRDFVALLVEKKIPHEYRQHPGAHTWDFWNAHVKEFLDVATRRLKK